MTHILLCSFAVRVHDSQAYRKMDVTRECISHMLELRKMPLSLQTGHDLVNAAVVCAVLAFTLISLLMPLALFVRNLVFSALISMR